MAKHPVQVATLPLQEPYRCTGKEALLIQAQRLRSEADRLQQLADCLPTDISQQADEALWLLIHHPKIPLRS